jgi:small subunit ribosomal protein S6
MVLLDNREVKKGWDALKSNVVGLFEKHGVDVVSARRWDERRLAYPIMHQMRGTYLLVYYRGETVSEAPIRRELEYNEAVLRHLTIRCDEIPGEAYEPEAEFDESAVRVEDGRAPRSAVPDEEESSEPTRDEGGDDVEETTSDEEDEE